MSLSKIRLAAFDMDGTLLNHDSQMAEVTKEACKQLQQSGCKLVLATGRTFSSAKLPIDQFPFDGYVCSNGATIHESDGTMVHMVALPAEMLVDAIPLIRQHHVYYELHDATGTRWMVQEDREHIEGLIKQDLQVEGISLRRMSFYKICKPVDYQELVQSIASGKTTMVKLFIWHHEEEVLKKIRAELAQWEEATTITSSSVTNIEILAKGVSKWKGLQYFLTKWSLSAEEAAAFGDADNDLDILSHVGHPIAMENAPAHIKHIAKYTAGHHDQDGVAHFIFNFMLPKADA